MTVSNVTGDSTSGTPLRDHLKDKDNPHEVMHDQLMDVTPDQHHNRAHNHSDPLDGVVSHTVLSDITPDDHHPQLHDLTSHTDVTLTGLIKGEGLWYDDSDGQFKNRASATETWPTGLVSGGELNIINTNDIEVIAGLGAVVDGYTAPIAPAAIIGLEWPTLSTPITAAPSTAGSIVWFTMGDTGVPSSSAADIVINVGEIRQYSAAPSPTLQRQEIPLGLAVHNGVAWQEVSSPDVINQSAETLREYVTVVNNPTSIISGGTVREIAAFSLEQDAGVLWENNRNWHVDKSDPNREALPARSPLNVEYVNRDFTDVGAVVTVIDPSQWDNAGTVEAIPNPANTSSIQRVYLDVADNFWILWGQNTYSTFATALASVGTDDTNTIVPTLLQDAIFLGHIVSGKNENSWGVGDAQFIPAGGGGGGGGSTGTPITDHNNLNGITANDHHNQIHLLYGSDHSDVNTAPTLEPRHVLQQPAPTGQWEVDYRAKFLPFVQGTTYYPQETVWQDGWLSVANKETTDYPAPVGIGPQSFIYQGASPDAQSTAKQIIFGNRYTPSISFYTVGLRIYTTIGNEYTVFAVNDPLGFPVTTQIGTFVATVDGWTDIAMDLTLILAGQVFDLVAVVQEPDPTPTTFTGNWDYDTPNNAGTPVSGQINHANQANSQFRIHKTDDDGGDRSAELGAMTIGDIIDWGGGGTRWAIQSIQDNGTWINFGVAPASQEAPDGVHNFTFETVTATPITRMEDVNYWLTNADVDGLYIEDDTYDNIVPNDNAYGVDLFIQEATISDDWDIYGAPGGGGGGGGGSFVPDLFTGAGTTGYVPDPVTEQGNFLKDDGTWDSAGGATESKIQQTAHGFAPLDAVRFTGVSWVKAQADDISTTALGIVVAVADVDNFTFAMSGRYQLGALTADEWYYLSDTVAGGIQTTEPGISQPIIYAEDGAWVVIYPYRPSYNQATTAPIVGEVKSVLSIASLPFGWHLADGTNGTQDLRGKAIFADGANGIVAGADGGALPVGGNTNSTGAHTHTTNNTGSHNHGNTGSGGIHSHNIPGQTRSGDGGTGFNFWAADGTTTTGESSHVHTTGTTGGHVHTALSDGNHSHTTPAGTLPPYQGMFLIQYTGVA